jgi:sterol desaturase/sphingolipid hydroxylase (fatty acid hydroxylase superfamily)
VSRESKRPSRKLPGWLTGLLILGAAGAVLTLEACRPLRKARQHKAMRDLRNLSISIMTAATIRATEKPLVEYLLRLAQTHNLGLLRVVRLPSWLEVPLAVLLLDYTLFRWHILTHRVRTLWRLHQAHHVDLDLSASTALRFHPGEMLLSSPWRGAQVVLLGVSPLSLSVWQTLTFIAILFHHSNIRLPYALERRLCRVVVTPRMHAIHHSIVHQETDSNWTVIFSWWDYLHGTVRLNVPQEEITIGVPAYQKPEELTLIGILRLPWTADRPSWRIPGDGTPRRDLEKLPGSSLELMP